jgi:hypothetical protein
VSVKAIRGIIFASTAACCGLWVSCAPNATDAGLYQRLVAEDPSVRLTAIVEAGERKDRRAVPLLVERLGDSDSDVRLVANVALEKITGMTMGYECYEPEAKRQAAIERWRWWLRENNVTHPAGAAAVQSATRASEGRKL